LPHKFTIMSSSTVFYAIGHFLEWLLGLVYDNVGNVFNYACICLGFFGLFYWLIQQRKFNDIAAKNPDQIK